MKNGKVAVVVAATVAMGLSFLMGVQAQPPFPPIGVLVARVAALEAQVAALENKTQFMSVDTTNTINGLSPPHAFFEGANVHIRSGSGCSNDGDPDAVSLCDLPINLTGLGNLIVGYNELPPGLMAGERGGSHNLVIGFSHKYSSSAGFVAGVKNTITGTSSSISGGFGNEASGLESSISGGLNSIASGNQASVSGGASNVASGNQASVSGGISNEASGVNASVSGGFDNESSFNSSTVSGGTLQVTTADLEHLP